MNPRPARRGGTLCAAALLLNLAMTPAFAQVDVRFIAAERYTDAENRSGSGLTLHATLTEVRRLFETLGVPLLRPGESLAIEVLDIDLAGLDAPSANVPYGLRVVSDITPPRLRLRYALKARGRTLASGEETVTDLNFLMRYGRGASGRSFHHERELIRDWLQARISRHSRS